MTWLLLALGVTVDVALVALAYRFRDRTGERGR